MITFGERLRIAIRRSGMTMVEVAREFGCSATTIGNWVNGRTTPKVDQAVRCSEILGVDPAWLLVGVERDGE